MRYQNILTVAILLVSFSAFGQDSLNVSMVGRYGFWYSAEALAVEGRFAYVAAGWNGLRILNVENLAVPCEVGYFSLGPYGCIADNAYDVDVSGGLAYLATRSGLYVIDLLDPTRPERTDSLFYGYTAEVVAVDVEGDYAYLAVQNDSRGFRIVNVSNPSSIFEVGAIENWGSLYSVDVVGDYAYLGCIGRIRIVDVSNPSEPDLVSTCTFNGRGEGIVVRDDYAYVAAREGGLRIIDISNPEDPDLVGSLEDLTYAYGVDVSGNTAYVTGYDYTEDIGWVVSVNISDPSDPVMIDSCNMTYQCEDVVVVDSTAFLASYGLKVLDISSPGNLLEISYHNPWGGASGAAVYGDYAFVMETDCGMQMLSLENYACPVGLGRICVNRSVLGVSVEDQYAYVSNTLNGWGVVDISNPDSMTFIGVCQTPGSATQTTLYEDLAYVAARTGGIRVINISDPTQPYEVGSFEAVGYALSVEVIDGMLYVGTASNGFWILDISNPVQPVELGSILIPGWFDYFAVKDTIVYVSNYGEVFYMLNVVDPQNIQQVGTVTMPHGVVCADVSGDYLFGVGGPGHPEWNSWFWVADITDPLHPQEVGYYFTPGDAVGVIAVGDYAVVADTYFLCVFDCSEAMSVPDSHRNITPADFKILSIYPNPFNQQTSVIFDVPNAQKVQVGIYNLLGQRVTSLVNQSMIPGSYRVLWDAGDLPSGVYFVQMSAGDFVQMRKVVLLK
ncbi:hypothetical protein AMJ86_08235 [bacterium SM23_57]|nr:MAG: hypothetical protein AMJ86_08235 [bacterium SM23_57]